jgi:cell division protein ZipA
MDEMRIILIVFGLILLAAIYWMGRRDERRAQEKKHAQQKPASQTDRTDDEYDLDGDYDGEVNLNNDSLDYDQFYMSETDNDVFFKSSIKKVAPSASFDKSGYSTSSSTHTSDEALIVSRQEPAPKTVELPAGVEPLLINLMVMAPQDMTFDPHYLKQTLDDSGLRLGDMNIYHYFRRPIADLEQSRGQRLFSVASLVEPGYFDPRDIHSYRTPGLALFLQLPGPIDGVLAFEKMHQMGEMLAKRLSGTLCDDKRNKITTQSVTHIKDKISEYNLKLRTKFGRTVH